jgi:hypothetical protein
MIPEGPEKSSRRPVWVERDGSGGWGCTVCSWVFIPSRWPAGKSLNEKIENSRKMLSGDFQSHDCNNHQRSEAPRDARTSKDRLREKPESR